MEDSFKSLADALQQTVMWRLCTVLQIKQGVHSHFISKV